VLFTKNNYSDQVEEDEMGRACSTNGGEEERIYVISGKARRKETTRKTETWVVENIKMDLREIIEWY
jgi:hypothetical protein